MCTFTISLCLFWILYRLVMWLLICQLYLYLFMFSPFELLLWTSSLVNVCCDGIFHSCSAWALSLQLWSLWGVFTGKKTLWNFKTCDLWTWDTCIIVIAHVEVCTDLNKIDLLVFMKQILVFLFYLQWCKISTWCYAV